MIRTEYSESEIKSYSQIINEFVLKYEWILARQIETASEIDLPSLLFIRQMSDIADAISILISKASGDAIEILLRNLFELEMNFEYLESNYEKNAVKFLYFYYRKKYELLSQEIPGTKENIDLIKILEQDSNVHKDTLDFISKNTKSIKDLKSLEETLSNQVYFEVNKNYFELPNKDRKYWYQLMQGPKSFYDLVKGNGKISLYNARYKTWSELVHGSDIVNRNLSFEKDVIRIVSKRNPADLDFKVFETISILKRRFMNYTMKYMSKDLKDIANWMIEIDNKLKVTFPEFTT